MKIHLLKTALSAVLACVSAMACADDADAYIGTFPEDAIVGDDIGISFSCNAEAPNFDDVDARLTRVRMDAGTIRVDYYRTGGVVPPSTFFCLVGAHVGELPAGTYPVKVYMHLLDDPSDAAQLVHETQFTVRDIAARNDEARPERNFSGVYWDSARSGESLTIAQSPRDNTLSMIINAYSPQTSPFWMYFVSDRWVTPNQVEGRVYAAIGPSYFVDYGFHWPGAHISQIGTGTVNVVSGSRSAGGTYDLTIDGQRIHRIFSTFPQ